MATPPRLPPSFLLIRSQMGARCTSGGASPAPAARCSGLPFLSELVHHRPDVLPVSAGEEANHRESPRCQVSGRMKPRFTGV